jgi:hypothetical protein
MILLTIVALEECLATILYMVNHVFQIAKIYTPMYLFLFNKVIICQEYLCRRRILCKLHLVFDSHHLPRKSSYLMLFMLY